MDFIPVLIGVGIIGFLVWKNWDKIKEKIKKPKPESVTVVPEPVAPPPDVSPGPITPPDPPSVATHIVNEDRRSVTERLFGISPEVAAYRDGLVEASRDKFDPLEALPKLMPGTLLLGSGYGHGTAFKQALCIIGPAPVEFAIAVPEGYSGSVYFDLTPHPQDPNGDAYCQFTIKEFTGKVVADVQGRLDQVKVALSGVEAKGKVKVSRGTYLARVKANKDCRTLFSVTEG